MTADPPPPPPIALPATMRVVDVASPGGPEQLRVVAAPVPEPGPDEVLIRVEAAGVNRPDVAQRQGHYPPPPDASPVLGLEVAGRVVARGDGAGRTLEDGAHVAALVNGGGYAEYCLAPARQCLPIPAGYDAVRAAALPENMWTVWANVFGRRERNGAALVAGETLLVHGGTSGIGLTAIQLARACGAQAIATAGTDEKCDACVRHGAAHAINYRAGDWAGKVRAATEGRGVDVVLDIVGAPYFADNLSVLAPGGRLSIIAFLGGAEAASVDLLPIMMRRLTVTGATMRRRSGAEKGEIGAALHRAVWPLLEQGVVSPVIEATFPLDAVADAHRLMESSRHVGKIVLTLAPPA